MSTSHCARLDAHVSGCAGCQRDRSVQSFVHEELRRELTRFHAPAALHHRVRKALRAGSPQSRGGWWRRLGWSALTPAAGVAFAVLFCANVVILAALPTRQERLADDVVTSHVRALVAAHMIDVESSDRHTVKPWYTGRLDFSPPVRDFVDAGFPLVGGRVDYVDGRTVAALVYRHGAHLVDVFVWPASDMSSARAASIGRRGYNLMHATHAGMTYWLASDLEKPELARLAELLADSHAM